MFLIICLTPLTLRYWDKSRTHWQNWAPEKLNRFLVICYFQTLQEKIEMNQKTCHWHGVSLYQSFVIFTVVETVSATDVGDEDKWWDMLVKELNIADLSKQFLTLIMTLKCLYVISVRIFFKMNLTILYVRLLLLYLLLLYLLL